MSAVKANNDDEALEAMRYLLKTWKTGMAMIAFAVLAASGFAAIVTGIGTAVVLYYCTFVYVLSGPSGFGFGGGIELLIRVSAAFGIWSGIAVGSMLAFAGLDRLDRK